MSFCYEKYKRKKKNQNGRNLQPGNIEEDGRRSDFNTLYAFIREREERVFLVFIIRSIEIERYHLLGLFLIESCFSRIENQISL